MAVQIEFRKVIPINDGVYEDRMDSMLLKNCSIRDALQVARIARKSHLRMRFNRRWKRIIITVP